MNAKLQIFLALFGRGGPRLAPGAADARRDVQQLEVTAGFLGRDASFHASFADLFTYLNIGLMAAGEARKDRFLIPVDFMWMKLSDDRALPQSPFPGATSIKVKVTQSVFTPKAGYLLVDNEKLKVDGTLGSAVKAGWDLKQHAKV